VRPHKEGRIIKSLSLLTRKDGISHDAFIDHWVNVHAPMVRAVPEVRRYVLSFVSSEPTRSDIPTQAMEVDCIAELWYDDVAAMERAARSAAMLRVRADGAEFLGRIKTFITEEKIVIG
jgi:uncharacterized protein (TIGR02118 family)